MEKECRLTAMFADGSIIKEEVRWTFALLE